MRRLIRRSPQIGDRTASPSSRRRHTQRHSELGHQSTRVNTRSHGERGCAAFFLLRFLCRFCLLFFRCTRDDRPAIDCRSFFIRRLRRKEGKKPTEQSYAGAYQFHRAGNCRLVCNYQHYKHVPPQNPYKDSIRKTAFWKCFGRPGSLRVHSRYRLGKYISHTSEEARFRCSFTKSVRVRGTLVIPGASLIFATAVNKVSSCSKIPTLLLPFLDSKEFLPR